jgi:hypothetical protein
MAYFQTQNLNLGKFWRVLRWTTMLVYFMTTESYLWPFGIFCGHLVCFMVIWYNPPPPPFWCVVQRKIWQPCYTLAAEKCQLQRLATRRGWGFPTDSLLLQEISISFLEWTSSGTHAIKLSQELVKRIKKWQFNFCRLPVEQRVLKSLILREVLRSFSTLLGWFYFTLHNTYNYNNKLPFWEGTAGFEPAAFSFDCHLQARLASN